MKTWSLRGFCATNIRKMYEDHCKATEFFEILAAEHRLRIETYWAGRNYVRLVSRRARFDKQVLCRTRENRVVLPNTETAAGRLLARQVVENAADLLDWGTIADFFDFKLRIDDTKCSPKVVVSKDTDGRIQSTTVLIDLPDGFTPPISYSMEPNNPTREHDDD